MSQEPLPVTPRTSRSGCLIALYVLLAFGIVTLVLVAAGAWVFLRSETGQRVTQAVTEGISLTREAQSAPGTEALRAAGCSQAMVIPTGRMLELASEFAAEARTDPGADAGPFGEASVVMCQLDVVDDAPDCPEVARVYAGAVPDGPERFGVVVQQENGRRPVCQGSYGRDGSVLEPLQEP